MKLSEWSNVGSVGELVSAASADLDKTWPGARLLQYTVRTPDGEVVSFALDPETGEYEVAVP